MTFAERLAADATANAEALAALAVDLGALHVVAAVHCPAGAAGADLLAEAKSALAELAPAAGDRGDRLIVAADLEVKAADRRGRFAVPGEVAAAVRSFLRRNPMPA